MKIDLTEDQFEKLQKYQELREMYLNCNESQFSDKERNRHLLIELNDAALLFIESINNEIEKNLNL